MNRLGQLLRNFRRKLRQTYILPNQDSPSKLSEVLAKYSAILKAEDWVNFVNYTATEEYKVKSAKKLKWARSEIFFPHTMGRDGYAYVKEKMVKEKGGYAEEWENGVTYKRYFDLPRSKQAYDERILLLESQLDVVSPVEIHPINSSADEEGGTTVLGCDQNDASIRKEMQKGKLLNLWELRERLDQSERILQVKIHNPKKMCRYYHNCDGKKKIMLHNKGLPKDCYKVSIDKSLVDAAFIPDVGSNGCTTVLDAVGGFVAWPKNQVVFDPKATPPRVPQMITVENKTAPKVPTKRKNFYVSSDAMQKEANKKRVQRPINHKSMIQAENSGNDSHFNECNIRTLNKNEEPMAEVQTTDDNVSATGQQHTEQPEFNNEGKVDQNAEQCHDIRPLPAKLTDNMTTKLSESITRV
ncbi:hypothetical protein Tco_0323748 [Tanacetum coccineum]